MVSFSRHIWLSLLIVASQTLWAGRIPATPQSGQPLDVLELHEREVDSIRVSILTCTPGSDLYAKFGHTALRVKNISRNEDVVFNYGCFNYDSQNFIFKFLLGQTDYILAAEPYDYLISRYGTFGNGVSEQVLNLSSHEANRLFALLLENLRPENQEYRYVWLYDNCTERARDMVEKAIEGEVVYEKAEEDITVRQLLHRVLDKDPWLAFGIDMILGAEIDCKTGKRIQMFLPNVFSDEASQAVIRHEGTSRPYITQTQDLIEEINAPQEPSVFLSPVSVFGALLCASVLLLLFEVKTKRRLIWFDLVLMLVQGTAGVLITFLFFFSTHPAVDSNWLVAVFNPIVFLYLVWMVVCHEKKKRNTLSYINLAVLAGFLITMAVCPQSFHPATYLVVFILLTRAASQSHFAYHLNK